MKAQCFGVRGKIVGIISRPYRYQAKPHIVDAGLRWYGGSGVSLLWCPFFWSIYLVTRTPPSEITSAGPVADGKWVEIEFDCLPLRSAGPLEVPADASPKYAAFVERLGHAVNRHGTLNTYYLHRGFCRFHVTNAMDTGYIHFIFEGTLLTDQQDVKVMHTDLEVSLGGETCDWLSEPIVQWFRETVPRAVRFEFERYIAAGDLTKTQERLRKLQEELDQGQGFLGMYL